MRSGELRRWLKNQGCAFEERRKHTKITLGDKATYLPRHPGMELNTKTMRTILKELGLTKE